MAPPVEPERPPPAAATEAEVDLVLAEAGGDPRLAIRNLLHDVALLARDSEASVSKGYVRSRPLPARLRRLR